MVVYADEVVGTWAGEGCVEAAPELVAGSCGNDIFTLSEACVPGPEGEFAFKCIGVTLRVGENEDMFALVHSEEGE